MAESFASIRVEVADRALAERVAAEAWAAGASGLEERGEAGAPTLLVYAPAARAAAVRRAVCAAVGRAGRVGPLEAVPPVDWARAWQEGLGPVVISARLAVRPSFAAHAPSPGQGVLVVDPGQAFGTGHHPSTRLALELLDELAPQLARGARVLDVGTGSGVLALAALRLGARRAVACDLDPLAARYAAANAAANGLAERLDLWAGGLEALGPARFEVVVANLLRRELLPLLGALAARLAAGGAAVLSGLVAEEEEEVAAALRSAGLAPDRRRWAADERGERWLALSCRRASAPASGRAAAPGCR